MGKIGSIPWNKGLTKANDPRINGGCSRLTSPWLGKKRDMPWLKEYNFKSGHKPYQAGQAIETLQKEIINRLVDTDDCIEWNKYRNRFGYGIFRFNGRIQNVHRMVWELNNGEIPCNMFICHHCDNPPCFNPKHLFLGTHTDNMRDMKYKYRNKTSARGLILKGSVA